MTEKTGTFLVTHADEGSAVFRDVSDGQVHTMASNPDVAERDVLEATIRPQPPMEVAWEVVEVEGRRAVELVDTDLAPTTQAMEIAADQAVGEVERVERAGDGEIHVLSVPADRTADAADDVLEDTGTLERAARLGAVRVEVRTDDDEGVVNVRYLPD